VPPILTQQAFLKATATSFFFFASLNCFFLLPLYVKRLGGTEVAVGIVMGTYSAIGILCQPLIGPWVDVLGRRPFMLLGTMLIVLSSFLAFMATGVVALGFVRALQGLGFSAFFVANYSYVLDLVPIERRGWALGIYGLSGMASTALAPLFGETVIRNFGFRPLFVACGLLALVTGAIVWTLRERERIDVPTAPDWESIRTMLGDLRHRHMAITVFFGLGSGTLFAFLPTFGEGIGVRTLALFYIAYACAAMGVRVVAGHWIDTRGRRAVIVPSMFLQAAGVALLAALAFLVARVGGLPPLPVLFVAGLIGGGAHGFLYPGLAALVADQAHETRRGAVIGVFSAVFLIGNSGGAFVFGYVAHRFGYGVTWSALTVLLLAGAVLSLGLRDDRASQSSTQVALSCG
jgi:MFS family permease